MNNKKSILASLKSIFAILIFKKPYFEYIDYVDIVLKKRSYFLFTWQFANAFKISIKRIHFVSYKKGGSAILKVPDNVDLIEIKISNFWRKTIVKVPLRKVEIDVPIDFNLLTKSNAFIIKAKMPKVSFESKISGVKFPSVAFKKYQINPPLFSLKVKSELLEYPN